MGYNNIDYKTKYEELFKNIDAARIEIEGYRKSIEAMISQISLHIEDLRKKQEDLKEQEVAVADEINEEIDSQDDISVETTEQEDEIEEQQIIEESQVIEDEPEIIKQPEKTQETTPSFIDVERGYDKSSNKKNEEKDNKKRVKKIKTTGSSDKKEEDDWKFVSTEESQVSGGVLTQIRKPKATKKKTKTIVKAEPITSATLTTENITIKNLSEKIGKPSNDIVKQLFLLGISKTINETIDFDTASLVANELGVTLYLDVPKTTEEMVLEYYNTTEQDDLKDLESRPPIVTIMGHVDHGKTSILDFIRKTNVTKREAGGITQHIGAYSITFNKQKITFVDTPGHAAFTDMRARGANLTDIVIIVVAADDGVMPQTIEAINHSKAANASIIVAINKIDKGVGNIDRIYTQLSEQSLLPEEWGGDTPIVKVSAKTGEGINDLLETILVLAEIKELKANPKRKAQGVIVEAKLDKGMGPVATVIIQNGTLTVGSYVVVGLTSGKIRAMYNDLGKRVKLAGPSDAVSIQGLQDVPLAGDMLLATEDEKTMRQVVQERLNKEKTQKIVSTKASLDDLYREIEEGKLKNLNLIIKTDVQGSAEAIKNSLEELSNEEVKVNVIHAMAGAINESDIILAETTNSVIIGFNVRPDAKAKMLAEEKGIEIKLYRVIYDAIDDVSMAIKGLTTPKFREEYLGSAEVKAVYKISGVGLIAGCIVKDGKIVRNANVRLIRDNIVIAETSITSLKRVKDDVKEVSSGIECGIGLDKIDSLEEGDIIESFLIKADK